MKPGRRDFVVNPIDDTTNKLLSRIGQVLIQIRDGFSDSTENESQLPLDIKRFRWLSKQKHLTISVRNSGVASGRRWIKKTEDDLRQAIDKDMNPQPNG